MWLHAHVGFWTLGLIVFVLSFILLKAGKEKAAKILHMILRVLLILIFITGAEMVGQWYSGQSYGWPTLKGIFGLLILGMMEMILTKTKKKQGTLVSWIILIISLIGVFYIGYGVL
ncbi:putative membrane protein [Pullulanibacillus pueri]|uniref:Uncharacterized protein n=1 Tax=Pullulanibacillus pueri TaxID=1437324 RepID=A0A8J2ZZJ5_9BACL|nr:DUF1516 family protein [Pullulanibacillus pueri]MBM7680546.1 putative membrane protein [Pullulanibacillus pueri]GGH88389.1 hypothetical protein GCM10007096_40610 [Pullulanibacillus pueri]